MGGFHSMPNPFLDIIKADELEARQAHHLFVPEASPIWRQIQSSRNQIIVGPRGSGKTIALRQLDHRTMQDTLPFIGLYIQLSRISTIFQSLFEHASREQDEKLLIAFRFLFSDYLWFSIVQKLAEFFTLNPQYSAILTSQHIERLVRINVGDLSELEDYCREQHREIEHRIQEWGVTNTIAWNPVADLPSSLGRCAEILRKICTFLPNGRPSLYLLFDESSPIPVQCQRILNGLLQRGRPYCVKLAIRPFEWDSFETVAHRHVELNTDVSPLFIRYPNELEGSYVRNMCRVVERVLETRSPNAEPVSADQTIFDCEKIFPTGDSSQYSGFTAICAASSGNPQNLLQICSCIYEMYGERDTPLDTLSFPPSLQHEAICAWSKDYEDQNPYENSRAFCRGLLRTISRQKPGQISIGFSYAHEDTDDLFTTEYLPTRIGDLIKPAYSGGFLRSISPSVHSLVEVPADFQVNRGLLPRANLPLDLPVEPTASIDSEFVRNNVRNWRNSNRDTTDDSVVLPIKAFLSTAFSPATRQQRVDIKEFLKREQVNCIDVEDAIEDQFLFSSISGAIKNSTITILDATELRPYTMLEIGLCAGQVGKPRDVICVVDGDYAPNMIANLPEFIRVLPIKIFTFEEDRMRRMAAEVSSHAKKLIGKKSEFSHVALTGTQLRSRRKKNTVYISLPESAVRDRAISRIRESLEREQWSVIVEEDIKAFSTNSLQVPIQCAFMSRIGVIDTSGGGTDMGPDLLQCYKLGLFVGKRSPWRVLQTESGRCAHPKTFSSVPSLNHKTWNTLDELVDIVRSFVLGGSST